MEIKVKLPDGQIKGYSYNTDISAVAESISPSLKKNAVAGKVDGKLVDLHHPLVKDSRVEIVTLDSKEGQDVHRHSTAHLMAQAIKRIYGGKR